MYYARLSVNEFVEALASGDPTPGGGGAAAAAGAVGAALGSMVCNLTAGKKKYDAVREDIIELTAQCRAIAARLAELIDEDAEAFGPLSRAYGLPKDDPERYEVTERALRLACTAPLEIMKTAGKAIELHSALCKKGTAAAISDVGAGVLCCKAALEAASLNVFINTKSMRDERTARKLETEADEILSRYCPAADAVYADVLSRLRMKPDKT